jgi:hypothetical protein
MSEKPKVILRRVPDYDPALIRKVIRKGIAERLGAALSLRPELPRILRTSSVLNYVKRLPRIFKG